ncbi:MAG TPA: helix-turn-helix transcriptional regulator [Candidatus Acidoferrales bacterium]|nr:helix-turn-helix transcriptional regulator [Candidatus Acidoferrales bacterium]
MTVPIAIPARYRPACDVLFWLPFVVWYLRVRMGLSQAQLARVLHKPRTHVCKIETNKATPIMGTLFEYADGLGVSMRELLGLCEWMAKGDG